MAQVEVVYVPVDAPIFHAALTFVAGMTVQDALEQSKLFLKHPDAVGLAVGVFSEKVDVHHHIRPSDRVEVYRPLLVDPKEKRRRRAKLD